MVGDGFEHSPPCSALLIFEVLSVALLIARFTREHSDSHPISNILHKKSPT